MSVGSRIAPLVTHQHMPYGGNHGAIHAQYWPRAVNTSLCLLHTTKKRAEIGREKTPEDVILQTAPAFQIHIPCSVYICRPAFELMIGTWSSSDSTVELEEDHLKCLFSIDELGSQDPVIQGIMNDMRDKVMDSDLPVQYLTSMYRLDFLFPLPPYSMYEDMMVGRRMPFRPLSI